jgi:hypothetical protein
MFVLVMLLSFVCGVSMIQSGHPLLADFFVCVSLCFAAEILRPEKSTLNAIAWMKANLKWICFPLLALYL